MDYTFFIINIILLFSAIFLIYKNSETNNSNTYLIGTLLYLVFIIFYLVFISNLFTKFNFVALFPEFSKLSMIIIGLLYAALLIISIILIQNKTFFISNIGLIIFLTLLAFLISPLILNSGNFNQILLITGMLILGLVLFVYFADESMFNNFIKLIPILSIILYIGIIIFLLLPFVSNYSYNYNYLIIFFIILLVFYILLKSNEIMPKDEILNYPSNIFRLVFDYINSFFIIKSSN